jgi:cysteinyl-tRNA synthetase
LVSFTTSSGKVTVDNWGYELQGTNGNPLDGDLLASATHDFLVIDSTRDGSNAERFTADEITRMKDGMGGPSVVASYISIGEAAEFRDYWKTTWTSGGEASDKLTSKAPDWLGPVNADWPESRKVRYWDKDWQDLIFNDKKTGDFDAIVKAGFDAAYLDIVDAYYFWGAEASAKDRQPGDPANTKQAAQRMVDFIVALTEHARKTNPDFFVIPQNGAFIMEDLGSDSARKKAYLGAIGGIAVEDVYYGGDADENNKLNPDRETIDVLKKDFLANGKPVFAVDYINGTARIDEFNKLALKDGFIPYAAPDRDLDRLAAPHDGDPVFIRPTDKNDSLRGSQLADTIDGLAGSDRIDGRNGNDRLDGGKGNDTLIGGSGNDKLSGGAGNDKLSGGAGKDVLTGNSGADIFVFETKLGASNIDTISDFSAKDDTIWLDDDIFAKAGKVGDLLSSAFHTGTKAHDASDRIIYDKLTGKLFYDADGTGKTAAVQFAQLDKNLGLTAGDFDIIG